MSVATLCTTQVTWHLDYKLPLQEFDLLSEEKTTAIRVIALTKAAVMTSETLANSRQSTRRYKPEDSNLRPYRRQNLKPHKNFIFRDNHLLIHHCTEHSVSSSGQKNNQKYYVHLCFLTAFLRTTLKLPRAYSHFSASRSITGMRYATQSKGCNTEAVPVLNLFHKQAYLGISAPAALVLSLILFRNYM
jgi:hypothetical protein